MNYFASDSEFQCTKCESKYPQKTSLILHIASAHGLKCLLCEEKYSTMAELKVHFTSTHGLENANKNCTKPNFQTNSNQCTEKTRPSRFELPKKSPKKIITSGSNLENDSKELSGNNLGEEISNEKPRPSRFELPKKSPIKKTIKFSDSNFKKNNLEKRAGEIWVSLDQYKLSSQSPEKLSNQLGPSTSKTLSKAGKVSSDFQNSQNYIMQDAEEEITKYDMPPILTENESYKKKIDEKQPPNNYNATNPGINVPCSKKVFKDRGTKSSQSGLEENSFENSLENEIEEISRKGGLISKGIFSLVQILKLCKVTKVHSSY